MTYDQFENTLQDWLDQDRLDEAEQLLAGVQESDRARCAELLGTYHALFAGLAQVHEADHFPCSPLRAELPQQTGGIVSALGVALALALCLTVLIVLPYSMNLLPLDERTDGALVASAPPHPPTDLAADQSVAKDTAAPAGEDLSSLATDSLKLSARSMASRTEVALRSLNEIAGSLNPIDEQLAAYQEAAPLIHTLSRGLLPGPHSLGEAFSVLRESVGVPTSMAPEQPASIPATDVSSAGAAVG